MPTLKFRSAAKAKAIAGAQRVRAMATKVYCTLCTRTVEAVASLRQGAVGKVHLAVEPGQKCPRCSASLDAAYILTNAS